MRPVESIPEIRGLMHNCGMVEFKYVVFDIL
jgi:hypothetical protein